MEKKNMVLLTVIAVATLLVAVVGATFAYFTATIQDNRTGEDGEKGKTSITAGSVANNVVVGNIDSDAGTFEATDIYPGHKEVAGLSVTVTSDAETPATSYFDIVYNITENEFTANNVQATLYRSDSKVTLSENYFQCSKATGTAQSDTTFFENCTTSETSLGTKVGDSKPLTGNQQTITFDRQSVTGTNEPGKTVYYYVVLEYINQTSQQNDDFGKTLTGNVSIKIAAENAN